jgi:nucleoside-diphosphate-sugar epimerase
MGEVYALGGAGQYTWPQLHHAAAEAIVGRRRRVVGIPVWQARLLTWVVPGGLLPFNWDQVVMSQEDNTCDLGKFREDFGWEPAGFEAALRSYAQEMRGGTGNEAAKNHKK